MDSHRCAQTLRNETDNIVFFTEVFEVFGQPRSVTMFEGGTIIKWEYPRFGLTLSFDGESMQVVICNWQRRHPHPYSS